MEDVMSKTSYGKAALKKFGQVPEGFEIFAAEWLGKEPKDWVSMRVKGAQFKGRQRVPYTTMTTVVTRDEMVACEDESDGPKVPRG